VPDEHASEVIVELLARQRPTRVRDEKVCALFAYVLEYPAAYGTPFLYFLDGVGAYEGEVGEAVSLPLEEVEANALLAGVHLAEDVFALQANVDQDLPDALSTLKLGHADRSVALT
jgi:hypothetical protein